MPCLPEWNFHRVIQNKHIFNSTAFLKMTSTAGVPLDKVLLLEKTMTPISAQSTQKEA